MTLLALNDAITSPHARQVSRSPDPKTRNTVTHPAPGPNSVRAFVHDLRSPLANLSLLIEAIGNRSQSADVDSTKRIAARAMRTIERLDGMLAAALSRASVECDCPGFEPQLLTGIVDMAAALNEPFARSRNVRLHCYLADPVMVMGDADLLLRAVDNLLTNAIKFTPNGGVVVCQLSIEGDEARIMIEDQGPGLTKGDIARAFQPFRRLSAKSNGKLGSHGLGLSIVRDIAECHGGSVTAYNAADSSGAVFLISMPMLEAAEIYTL